MRSLCVLAAWCAVLGAQAGYAPAPPQAAEPVSDQSREAVRRRLERRLEQVRAIETRIESAIARLDAAAAGEQQVLHSDSQAPGHGGEPIDEVRAFVHEHLPELAVWLKERHEKSPEEARRMMHRLADRLRPIMALEEHEPDLFAMRLKEFRVSLRILEAAREYRAALRADDNMRAADLREELIRLLDYQLDLRMLGHQHELHQVEMRLQSIRAQLEHMEESRAAFIESRLDTIADMTRDPG